MVREIEFRGLSRYHDYFVYGALYRIRSSTVIEEAYIDRDTNTEKFVPYYVIPETIGQYIGVRDKRNKKVYEGDRVKGVTFDGMKIDGYVTFNDGAFCIKTDIATLYRWSDYDFEVVGHIYKQN